MCKRKNKNVKNVVEMNVQNYHWVSIHQIYCTKQSRKKVEKIIQNNKRPNK